MIGKAARTRWGFSWLLGLSLGASVAHATVTPVRGFQGATMYAIVTAEDDGTVGPKPKPGIYLWDRNKLGRLLFAGEVLEPREGGFFRSLEMSGRTRRHEAISVVNGQVKLFHAKSLGTRRGSILTLGEGDASIVAANDHAPVGMPMVTSEKDIAVWGKTNGAVEVLLFSVRTPTNPLGDGMTIAMVLKSNGGTQTELLPAFPPVLLDWKFHPERELVDFYFEGGVGGDPRTPGLRCPVVERTMSMPRESDPQPLAAWRETLAAELKGGKKKRKKGEGDPRITFPLISLDNGEVDIRQVPSNAAEDGKFLSVYDPVSSRHGVLSQTVAPALRTLDPSKYLMHGALETTDGVVLDWAREDGIAIYRRTDGRFVAVLSATPNVFVDYLPPPPASKSSVVDATFSYLTPADAKSPGLLVSSWRHERAKENQTYIQEVRIDGTTPRFGKFVAFFDAFVPWEQLEMRVVSGEPDAKGRPTHRMLLKKDLPPKSRSGTIHKLVGPWADLQGTLKKGAVSYIFPVADRHFSLGDDTYYRVFPQIRNVASANGFFAGGSSRDSDRLLSAEAVAPKNKTFEDMLPLAKTQLKRRAAPGATISLQAFLVDPHHAHGRSAQIAIRIHDTETGKHRMGVMGPVFDANSFVSFKFLPTAKRWSWEKEPELLGFGVLALKGSTRIFPIAVGKALDIVETKGAPNKGKNLKKEDAEDEDEGEEEAEDDAEDEEDEEDEVVVDGAAVPSESSARVIDANSKLNRKWIEALTPWVLENRNLTDAEIRTRLRFVDGVPYFIANPDLEPEDYDYAVLGGKDGVKLFLNRDLESKIKFDAEGEASVPSGWGKANSWAVTIGSSREKDFMSRMRRIRGAVEYKRDVLPEIRLLLESFASRTEKAKHVVYIVPAELKAYLTDYPLALYFREDDDDVGRTWSESNHKLLLSLLGASETDQETVLDNLRTMRELALSKSRTPVLVGALSDVQALGRPQANQRRSFRLKDTTLEKRNILAMGPEEPPKPKEGEAPKKGKEESEVDAEEMRKTVAPHALYLLATDGERTSLQKFNPAKAPQIPMLLIGTEEEWTRLRAETTLETRWKLFEHFEERKLTTSTAETRRRVIRELLASSELKALGYRIDVSEIVPGKYATMNDEEVAETMARYIDQHTASLARQYNLHPFVALLRVLNALSEELTFSEELRAAGKVGRAAIGRVLTKVFPMPLSAQFLPENDPLRTVMNPDFLLWWDENGYKGDHRVKKEVQDALLAQLNSSSVKTIPASIMIYGSTGTGKTSLVKSLFRTLKLIPYAFDAANDGENRSAQSFFLDMNRFSSSVTDKEHRDSFNGEMLTPDQAIEHLHKFLSGPNGSQGFVCLDDFHSAPPEVRERFLKLIRNLANEPYYRVGSRNIPTRNIRLFVTLNPTDDQARIKKYTKNPKEGATDEEVILATLNQEGQNTFDKSHLGRFGLKLNIGSFTTSAKGPALTDQVRKELRSQFGTDGTFTVVAEESIRAVSEQFPDTDARSFLSAAARAITTVDVASDNGTSLERLFIVVPRPTGYIWTPETYDDSQFDLKGGGDENRIIDHANRVLRRLPVKSGYEGKIYFLIYLLNNFRKRLVETAFRAITNDPANVKSTDAIPLWLAPLARGFHDQMLSVPEYPLEHLELQPEKLLSHPGEAVAFRQTLAEIRWLQHRRAVQLPRVGELPAGHELTGGWGEVSTSGLTRQGVLKNTVNRLHTVTEAALGRWLQFDPRNPPDFETWIRSLPETEVVLQDLAAQMVEQYSRYAKEMGSREVVANAVSGRHPSPYETARLFAMALDRAIGQLPWGRVTAFLIDALDRMTADLTLGGERGVERLLFEGKTSPLVNMDSTYLLQVLRNYTQFGTQTKLEGNQPHEAFVEDCGRILEIAGHGGGQP